MNKFLKKIKEYLNCKDQFEICDLKFLRENKKDFIFFKNNISQIKEEILAREPINKDSKNVPTQQQLNYLFGRNQELSMDYNGIVSKGYITVFDTAYGREIHIKKSFGFEALQREVHDDNYAKENYFRIFNCEKNMVIIFKNVFVVDCPTGNYTFVESKDDVAKTIISCKESFADSFISINEINQLKTEEEKPIKIGDLVKSRFLTQEVGEVVEIREVKTNEHNKLFFAKENQDKTFNKIYVGRVEGAEYCRNFFDPILID
jgi:hypothetical protein